MHGIYNLKDTLCAELEEYGKKDQLASGDLEIIDKLSHAMKNIEKIIANYEEGGYSSRMYDERMMPPMPYYGRNNGYAREGYGRNGGYSREGRYNMSNRYSRGGRYYTADPGMVDELRDLMNDAPDENTRKEFQRLIDKLENM